MSPSKLRRGSKPLALSIKRRQNDINVTSKEILPRIAPRRALIKEEAVQKVFDHQGAECYAEPCQIDSYRTSVRRPGPGTGALERHGPYRTIAEYIPRKPDEAAFPYFRGNWAVGGKPLVDGAESILHNHRFIDAARALFSSSAIGPTFMRGKSKRANARWSDAR